MFLDYFALGLVVFVSIFIFYGIIVILDIPYEIAVHRNHPHQDAIHVAGWISLFTLHTICLFYGFGRRFIVMTVDGVSKILRNKHQIWINVSKNYPKRFKTYSQN